MEETLGKIRFSCRRAGTHATQSFNLVLSIKQVWSDFITGKQHA